MQLCTKKDVFLIVVGGIHVQAQELHNIIMTTLIFSLQKFHISHTCIQMYSKKFYNIILCSLYQQYFKADEIAWNSHKNASSLERYP